MTSSPSLFSNWVDDASAKALMPAVILGGVVRAILIIGFLPETYSVWFVPFLSHLGEGNWVDPWTSFLETEGRADSFPYGPVYLFTYGAVAQVATLIGGAAAIFFGLKLSVLVFELLLIKLVGELAEVRHRKLVLALMWLNPISIYVCYWHGQLDVLPVLLLVTSFIMLRDDRPFRAGIVFGLAVAAKSAMLIAAPFVLVMCIRDKRFQRILQPLMLGAAIPLCFIIPFLLSSGFQQMVLATPETQKILALSVAVPGEARIFIVPLALMGLLVFTWRVARYTWSSIYALVGAAFLILYILTPASPGWALWVVPFIPILLSKFAALTQIVSIVFLFAAALRHLVSASGAHFVGANSPFMVEGWVFFEPQNDVFYSFIVTAVTAAGLATFLQIIRMAILQDRFYNATRDPISILVAGDSGAGKDTFVSNFAKLTGEKRLCHISGDDYHIWDRHKPMWRALTHLNPRANHLDRYFSDVQTLIDGGAVSKRHYDHSIGRMTRPQRLAPREYVVASGLHALLGQSLNFSADVRVFLNMDEQLRKELKIRRDTTVRQHTMEKVMASLEKREPDSVRFIRPQIENADVSFQLKARAQDFLSRPESMSSIENAPIPMRLNVGLRTDEDFPALERMLVGAANAKVTLGEPSSEWHFLEIECDAGSEAISFAVRKFMPELFDYLSAEPQYPSGLNGVMQLVLLHCIRRKLRLSRSDSELP